MQSPNMPVLSHNTYFCANTWKYFNTYHHCSFFFYVSLVIPLISHPIMYYLWTRLPTGNHVQDKLGKYYLKRSHFEEKNTINIQNIKITNRSGN